MEHWLHRDLGLVVEHWGWDPDGAAAVLLLAIHRDLDASRLHERARQEDVADALRALEPLARREGTGHRCGTSRAAWRADRTGGMTMGMPRTLEEWREVSPAWKETASKLLPEDGYPGRRRRPRDPDETRALRKLGVDRQRPFGPANEAAAAALQIRMARKLAGLSQTELARRMGVTQQQVQRLEDPDKSNPTVATLRAVAEALGTKLHLRFEG